MVWLGRGGGAEPTWRPWELSPLAPGPPVPPPVQLRDLEQSGISCPPQHKISLPELSAQCKDEAGADSLFAQLCAHLGAASSLCIKPAAATAGLGLMEVGCGRDLAIYAAAVEGWVDPIPGSLLSREQDVPMAFPPPTQFVIESLITTDPLLLWRAADGNLRPAGQQQQQQQAEAVGTTSSGSSSRLSGLVHWAGGSGRWLEVSAHLFGEAGQMRCLGPSAWVYELQEAAPASVAEGMATAALDVVQEQLVERYHAAAALLTAAEASGLQQKKQQQSQEQEGQTQEQQQQQQQQQQQEQQEAGGGGSQGGEALSQQQQQERDEYLVGALEITPPPASVVHPDAVASAKLRLMLVADRLGISGVARVDALMHADTGELVVMDVHTAPDLSFGALLFRQVRRQQGCSCWCWCHGAAAGGVLLLRSGEGPGVQLLVLVSMGSCWRGPWSSDRRGGRGAAGSGGGGTSSGAAHVLTVRQLGAGAAQDRPLPGLIDHSQLAALS